MCLCEFSEIPPTRKPPDPYTSWVINNLFSHDWAKIKMNCFHPVTHHATGPWVSLTDVTLQIYLWASVITALRLRFPQFACRRVTLYQICIPDKNLILPIKRSFFEFIIESMKSLSRAWSQSFTAPWAPMWPQCEKCGRTLMLQHDALTILYTQRLVILSFIISSSAMYVKLRHFFIDHSLGLAIHRQTKHRH